MVASVAALLMLSHQVRLTAVGDIMLGRWVGRRIEREGVDSPFASVRSLLSRADLAVGNLECAVTAAPFVGWKRYQLRADPVVVSGLARAGFGVLSLQNNHAGDCGPAGIAEAKSRLRSAGIEALCSDPVIVRRNGLRIGFLGFCDLPPGSSFDAAVAAVRPKVDVLVAMVHWGIEGSTHESHEQRALARRLAADGVDLILGSHPHVLQPIRWIAGRSGRRCLVAYSLGNFVFDARRGVERQSEILSVTLGSGGVVGYSTIPVKIIRGYPAMFNPVGVGIIIDRHSQGSSASLRNPSLRMFNAFGVPEGAPAVPS